MTAVIILLVLVFLIGLFGLLTVYTQYYGMLKDLEGQGHYKNIFVKQIFLKYESIVKLEMEVKNRGIFVQKHLEKCEKYGMSLDTIEKISRLTIILNTGIGVMSVLVGLIFEMDLKTMAINLLVATFLAMLFYFLEELFDVMYLKDKLVMALEENLDNNKKVRECVPEFIPADKETKKEIKQLKKNFEQIADDIDTRRENAVIVEEIINQYLS